MRNLHLMPMNSTFDDDTVIELNRIFPAESNLFVIKKQREALKGIVNCIVNPDYFSVAYLNECYQEYHFIVLHSLFFSQNELLNLSDEVCKRIIWCVWGHDLYDIHKKQSWDYKKIVHESIHFVKMVFRGTHIKAYMHKKTAAAKVSKFHCIAHGYSYDERMIRKKYGKNIQTVNCPYFNSESESFVHELNELHKNKKTNVTNILIGHSGFEFLEHEKYLKLLSKYKGENIHINLVLVYGASEERIRHLKELAISLFSAEKVTILTEMLPKKDYFRFICSMDIAIFPFKHQSALGNLKRLAYAGVNLYLDPAGVIYKGFMESGYKANNCNDIGKVPFEKLQIAHREVDPGIPLFNGFNTQRNIEAWKKLLA